MAERLHKRLERAGRRLLVALLSLPLKVRRRPVVLSDTPRILVVRIDERLGNLLMTLPLIDSLRARFPRAKIELLANVANASLLAGYAAVDRFLPFDKRALLAKSGPLLTPLLLRRCRYELALDAGNPTDPSVTQSLLVRLANARHSVGYLHSGFGSFYSAVVEPAALPSHEVDMRLALLQPLPGVASVRLPRLPADSWTTPPLAPHAAPRVAINVGARLDDKRLDASTYARLAQMAAQVGYCPLLTYGPKEKQLAQAVAAQTPAAQLAPPSSLTELAALFAHTRAVVTCDTGPMHLAVAVGAPTCGIFVSTDPARYGYNHPPHTVVDARERPLDAWMQEVQEWLASLFQLASGVSAASSHQCG